MCGARSYNNVSSTRKLEIDTKHRRCFSIVTMLLVPCCPILVEDQQIFRGWTGFVLNCRQLQEMSDIVVMKFEKFEGSSLSKGKMSDIFCVRL